MRTRLILFFTSFMVTGCESAFLDSKPDKRLVVPSELEHFQALLDAVPNGMNQGPGLSLLVTDEFYASQQELMLLGPQERNSYLWAKNIYEGTEVQDWDTPYRSIFYSNVVLDGLAKLLPDSTSKQEFEKIRGSALFYRAFAHYNLAATFSAPFQKETAAATPGIPVRLTSDVNQTADRGTLQDTYMHVLDDLMLAGDLLPDRSVATNRPSKAAVKALLARVYLAMGSYDQALTAADQALVLQNELLDYNSLNAGTRRPFPARFSGKNPEIIFDQAMSGLSLPSLPSAGVDTVLYNSYHANDLRKTCFFVDRGAGVFGFKGSYLGSATQFCGLATDELYLIRAECEARQGQTALALKDLDTLLKTRFKIGTYKDLSSSDDKILDLVLLERRKQLIARGLRWTDLRRLNLDPRFAVELPRATPDGVIKLSPTDSRYTMPIPEMEIAMSGIAQNPR